MRRWRRDEDAQFYLLEAVMVALFIFIAIASAVVFRLPSSPETFGVAGTHARSSTILSLVWSTPTQEEAECNETPCPFEHELEQLVSLALGYRGATLEAGEEPDASDLKAWFDGEAPAGSRYVVSYSNGYVTRRLAPETGSPVTVTVTVSSIFVTPNWTAYDANRLDAAWVHVGEKTDFGDLTEVRDPLNRDQTEDLEAWTTLYGDRVPGKAVYGVHRACNGADCGYFLVAPSGVRAAGSQLLETDADAPPALRDVGAWSTVLGYNDTDPLGFGAEDPLYLDLTATGSVGAGDARLSRVTGCRSGATCIPGSFVRGGDSDVGGSLYALPAAVTLKLASADAVTEEGEIPYLDVADDDVANAGDVRLGRVGFRALGERVDTGHADDGASLSQAFTAGQVQWSDLDGDAAVGEGETIFLNLDGLGQTTTLEPFDVRWTHVDEPPRRAMYEFSMAVWYGL